MSKHKVLPAPVPDGCVAFQLNVPFSYMQQLVAEEIEGALAKARAKEDAEFDAELDAAIAEILQDEGAAGTLRDDEAGDSSASSEVEITRVMPAAAAEAGAPEGRRLRGFSQKLGGYRGRTIRSSGAAAMATRNDDGGEH
eukprot:7648827-Pyramimonas_sp.AAC.1